MRYPIKDGDKTADMLKDAAAAVHGIEMEANSGLH